MDIEEYYTKLNEESQDVFRQSINDKIKIGKLHHLSSCIYDFSKYITDKKEKGILENVSAQLDISNYNALTGLYRQAFSSMRLALEMGLACIYFSSVKIELHEWVRGQIDIKWSKLIDAENGVLSARFVKAFFEETISDLENFRETAGSTYRALSEYVHGNSETWTSDGIKIGKNSSLFESHCIYHEKVCHTILISLVFRYFREISFDERQSLEFILEEFGHISEIRNAF